ATIHYTATGGVAPVRWYLGWDSTCTNAGTGCSNMDVTTGILTAGTGAPGYVVVVAIDADGAETYSEVTVAGGGTGTVPWSAGPPGYVGIVVSKSPLTACPTGDDCGTLPNGCGGIVTCGTCGTGEICMGNTCMAASSSSSTSTSSTSTTSTSAASSTSAS